MYAIYNRCRCVADTALAGKRRHAMNWGEFVRRKRLDAGLGLRRFAELVDILPSNYNHMEKGRMAPPQGLEKLEQIAEALGIKKGSSDYDTLMDLAVANKDKLPADVEGFAKENKLVPALLRALDNAKMSKREFEELVRQLNDDLARPRRGEQNDGDA